jgi:hypothetical protein
MNSTPEDMALLKQLNAAGDVGRTRLTLDRLAKGG